MKIAGGSETYRRCEAPGCARYLGEDAPTDKRFCSRTCQQVRPERLLGRYCEMCDVWWSARKIVCPACGLTLSKTTRPVKS